MTTGRKPAPVSKLAGVSRVSAKARTETFATKKLSQVVQAAAAKSAPRKPALKNSATINSERALKLETAKRLRAALAARRTKAATNRVVGTEPIAVDPTDEAARTAI